MALISPLLFVCAIVDLYLIHSPNPGPERRNESWKALQKLVAQGKVKSIGKLLLSMFFLFSVSTLQDGKTHANV